MHERRTWADDSDLRFRSSEPLTLGVELELGLVEPERMDLAPGAPILVALLARNGLARQVKAEITTAMIELNSSVHTGAASLREELADLASTLVTYARRFDLSVIGGGTHPFQEWSEREIYPSRRFREVSGTYGYLARQFTVFGQHIHVGCASGDDALYLTRALTHFTPHFIALSAASPFWRGVDTGYECCRLNVVSAFPLSGCAPPLARWSEFERFVREMRRRQVVQSLKDFYWDVRPKPEFGTVEVRVCDTPVRVDEAVDMAALVQALAADLLAERRSFDDEYFDWLHARNRFQACRFGLQAELLEIGAAAPVPLRDAVRGLLGRLRPRFKALGTLREHARLLGRLDERNRGAAWLRSRFEATKDLRSVVSEMTRDLLAA
ncbi:MAG: glutamate--cysteine ligase [Gammaproteobacteria bacterium]|nr:glutamate--cysteine ligase [Gammaproteobacteria bacterium]